MPTTKRRLNPGVIQQLIDKPYRFQFFQAVRVLEHVFARQGDDPAEIVSKRLKFLNTLNLCFPASEIEQINAVVQQAEPGSAVPENSQADDATIYDSVAITPSFFGLLGVNGALPLTYTERLNEREVFKRDKAARAFLDIFNNRAAALFYGAWKKYRLGLQYELDKQGRFLPLAKALAGLGLNPVQAGKANTSGDVPDQAMAFYCAAIRHRPLSATYLQQVLAEYFRVPFQIEQLVGGWHPVPVEQRSYLGRAGLILGKNALVGERVWQRDLRLRLWIGPLFSTAFDDFLPGSSAATSLRKWLTLMAGCGLEYEVCLILRSDHVHGTTLLPLKSGRLGWDAFLVTHKVLENRADARYHITTLH